MITREQVQKAKLEYVRLKDQYIEQEKRLSLTKDGYSVDRLVRQGFFFFITHNGAVAARELGQHLVHYSYEAGHVSVDGYDISAVYYLGATAIGEIVGRLPKG